MDSMPDAEKAAALADMLWSGSVWPYLGTAYPERLITMSRRVASVLLMSPRPFRVYLEEPVFVQASNLVRRLGDLEMYRGAILREHSGRDPWRIAAISSSLMVGHMSPAKSVLDAGAILLGARFGLNVKRKLLDLNKATFTKALRERHAAAGDRYAAHADLIADVSSRRDVAVHQCSPLVVVHATEGDIRGRPPEEVSASEVQIKMAASPEARRQPLGSVFPGNWTDVTQFVESWVAPFQRLTHDLCCDLEEWAEESSASVQPPSLPL